MAPSDLWDRLKEYGADMQGISDRFVSDMDLYAECFADFLADPAFDLLEQSIARKDYTRAFEAAHAVKGLSGNLGLTPLYEVVCVLVESLRADDTRFVDEQYARVRDAYARLQTLCANAPTPDEQAPAARESAAPDPQSAAPAPARACDASSAAKPRKRAKDRKNRFMMVFVIALILVLVIIAAAFLDLIRNYRNNISIESANHLTEINYQIKLYVEARIENDWKTAYSVANNILRSDHAHTDDEARLLAFIQAERDIWSASDIIIYAQSGYCIGASGETESNDVASDVIYRARQAGEYMTILDSSITYTIPIDTQLHLDGSPIVAVSVVQDLKSFLDEMGISPFENSANVYLTQENGAIISRLSRENATSAFNILSFLRDREIVCYTPGAHADTLNESMTSETSHTYRMTDPAGDRYIVSTPVDTRHAKMRLFFSAPEAIVNRSMNGFANYIVTLSASAIAVLTIATIVIFLFLYQARKRQFDLALNERDRTFDLLVRNTNTAFGLFSIYKDTPLYVSQNVERILGGPTWTLVRTEAGYRMRATDDLETDALRLINEELRKWDGRGEFRSGYIFNHSAPNGAYFAIQLYPIDEGFTEYVGIAQDVTQTHDREEAVREALAMAERSNAAKNRFLSNMSHDIRTPMNAIINMTNFAIDTAGNPKTQLDYLNIIRESSEHLLRLVNDVLDMSRIESGQAVINADPFDIKEELERVCSIVRPLCAAKRQTFLTDFSGIHAAGVLGDQLKLSQIFMNLLSNAVKFTPENGAICFSVTEIPSIKPDLVNMRFVVEDNGIGIGKADIERIFEPFMRADDKRVSGIEGTGLGLPICKRYVDAMGGSITCESEADNGSAFIVELFFQRAFLTHAARTSKSLAVERPFAGLRCLLCEDNHVNQVIARTLLESVGFLVEFASNGREALNKLLLSDDGYYDVIYMDIQMPIMDGYQACVAIRESAHAQAKTIPIIAMTANVFTEDIEKARLAGMNGHLGKPIMVISLIEETDRVLHEGG